MKIQGVIFDFNGTLFQDGEFHVAAWQEISKELTGTKMSREEIEKKTHGACNEVTLDRLSGHTLSKAENLAWSRKKEALYRQLVDESKDAHLIAGAEAFFDCLKEKNIPFTIASASIKENIDFFFETFQLDRWFERDKIVYDDGSFPDKVPMFLKAAEILGCIPEKTLVIEDSVSGLGCAAKAGFAPIMMIAANPIQFQQYQNNNNVAACGYNLFELLVKLKEII